MIAASPIPYGRHDVTDADIAAVVTALRAPLLTCGPLGARFETAIGDAVGADHVSACSSGTAALHLAYAALGIGPGDEIITSPLTFSATASAAYQVGATVRFADVDGATGNLDPADVERLITARTRAIVPVHLGGLPAELDALRRLARARRLAIVEDACHALGAGYHDRAIGASADGSDAVVFSFHPVKHVTTGEGGAVCVRDPAIKRRIDRLRHHGIERERLAATSPGPWYYEVQEQGWNYRLSDIACALGLSQLGRLRAMNARRRDLAARYRESIAARFGQAGVVRPPVELPDRCSAYHLFAVAIDFDQVGRRRDQVMTDLAANGIGSQVHYIPLHHHPFHAARVGTHAAHPRPGADHYYARTLSLPLYPGLADADVTRIVDALARTLETTP